MGCGNNDMMNFVIFIAFVLFCVVIYMVIRKCNNKSPVKPQLFNADGSKYTGDGEDDEGNDEDELKTGLMDF